MLRDYILTIVDFVGLVQALFLAIVLWYLPGNHRRANHALGLLFLALAVQFSSAILQQNDLIYLAPLLILLKIPLLFLLGPLLYLYLWQITRPWDLPTPRLLLRHLAVFLLVAILYLPSFLFDHYELLHLIYYAELVKVYPDIPALTSLQWWLWMLSSRLFLPALALQLCTYLILNLHLLREHRKRIVQHFSATDRVSLNWMRNLLLAFCVICGVVAVRPLFANTGTGRLLGDLLQPLVALFLSALGIFGLLQKSIPLPSPVPIGELENPPGGAAKYQNSSLTEQLQREGLTKLRAFMQSAKPYLDSELTVVSLASGLGLPARHVSQIINGCLQQNFLDFINGYRIEEAKQMLANPAHEGSVLDIAMNAGFNSKSAFYGAFKRHTGQTPSAFRQHALAAADTGTALNRN